MHRYTYIHTQIHHKPARKKLWKYTIFHQFRHIFSGGTSKNHKKSARLKIQENDIKFSKNGAQYLGDLSTGEIMLQEGG